MKSVSYNWKLWFHRKMPLFQVWSRIHSHMKQQLHTTHFRWPCVTPSLKRRHSFDKTIVPSFMKPICRNSFFCVWPPNRPLLLLEIFGFHRFAILVPRYWQPFFWVKNHISTHYIMNYFLLPVFVLSSFLAFRFLSSAFIVWGICLFTFLRSFSNAVTLPRFILYPSHGVFIYIKSFSRPVSFRTFSFAMVRICQPGWLIQSYYRLGDRSSAPGGWKGFSSTLCVHTGSEAHLASRAMETGGGGGCGAFPWR